MDALAYGVERPHYRAVSRRVTFSSHIPLPASPSITAVAAGHGEGRGGRLGQSAIVTLLHLITSMLLNSTYVRVVALDFSKAFDTVRHSTLLNKMSNLAIPDNVYNWIRNFLNNRSHCTKFHGVFSNFLNILASVIQGSVIGPASYAIHAGDL